VLALVAAVLAASTSPSVLEPAMPWWEKITVTVDDKGKQQSCRYHSSLSATGEEECEAEIAASVAAGVSEGQAGLYSKFTFERRFSPGPQLDSGRMQPGDKLLGQQVMFLTIGADGSIDSCRILATSGEMRLAYGCEQAKTEQFRAQASASSDAPRQAFMTILAYGHTEQIA